MALKSEFCAGEGSCTAVIWCCHATCNDGISLVFKSIGQQEFKFSNFVASQCCTGVVIPFDEKFNIWICFVERLEIPWFDIGNTRHQLFSSQKIWISFENFSKFRINICSWSLRTNLRGQCGVILSLLWLVLGHLLRMLKLYNLVFITRHSLKLGHLRCLNPEQTILSRTFPLEINSEWA